MRRTLSVITTVFVTTLGLIATAPDVADARPGTGPGRQPLLFSPQGNNLEVYSTSPPFQRQTVITRRSADPNGWDINGQVCFLDHRRFFAGEDTGQPEPPPGWGVFRLRGNKLGKIAASRIGRLVPTYQPTDTEPDNYGCGVLPDGRIVTTVIGNNASGPEDGELLMWYPPLRTGHIPFCVLDTAIGTAMGIAIRDGAIYVASARGATAGVLRYNGPFPTSPDAAGGCGRTDAAGSPLVDSISRERFISPSAANGLSSPNAAASEPGGHWYVSSIINGVISDFDAHVDFVRIVLQPPPGDNLINHPYTTGTPLGLVVGPDGTLFYADLGLRITSTGIGPGSGLGSVRRIRFVGDQPQPPEVIQDGLTFPDGLGVRPPTQ